MSHPLISRSQDLARLHSEGYVIDIREGSLVVEDVPYESGGVVKWGILVCALEDDTEKTHPPSDHTVWWSGDEPNASLMELPRSPVCSTSTNVVGGVEVKHQLSIKRRLADGTWENYVDYFDKVTTYVNFLSRSARSIDPSADARTGRTVQYRADESVFLYRDGTAGVRGLNDVNKKVDQEVVAIIGTGGTGSYILDLISRTPVAEIHLFDPDMLKSHNGYRYPGVVTAVELQKRPRKVDYLASKYLDFRRCIHPHEETILDYLANGSGVPTFAFLAIDRPSEKRQIASRLLELGIPFIHVGMGVNVRQDGENSQLQGLVSATLIAPEGDWNIERVGEFINFQDLEELGVYQSNAQIVELNAINAALAIIQWKKYRGVYASLGEVDTSYDTELHLLTKRK